MDRNEIVEKVKEYANKLIDKFSIKYLILYGSYANGTARKDSDIDVGVIVESLEGDFLEAEIELFRLRRSIDERIEPVLLISNEDKSGFIKQITDKGIIIHPSRPPMEKVH